MIWINWIDEMTGSGKEKDLLNVEHEGFVCELLASLISHVEHCIV